MQELGLSDKESPIALIDNLDLSVKELFLIKSCRKNYSLVWSATNLKRKNNYDKNSGQVKIISFFV